MMRAIQIGDEAVVLRWREVTDPLTGSVTVHDLRCSCIPIGVFLNLAKNNP